AGIRHHRARPRLGHSRAAAERGVISRCYRRYRPIVRPEMSMLGTAFEMISATSRLAPQAIVQPRVPCPVFRNRFRNGVVPRMGGPSGVIDRSPVQNSARDSSPPLGKRSRTTSAIIRHRDLVRVRSYPVSSAVPAARIRSPRRVIATLWRSSMIVDVGDAAGSVIGIVTE